jgi:hypothetical protein
MALWRELMVCHEPVIGSETGDVPGVFYNACDAMA